MFRRILFAAMIAATLAATPVLAQAVQAAQTGTITGILHSASGQAVDGATVRVTLDGRDVATATATADGRFRVTDLPTGTYAVSAFRIGFTPARVAGIRVDAGAVATANLVIIRLLDPVLSVVSRKEESFLDAPAAVGIVEPAAIQRRPSATVMDHVAGVAGVDINKGGIGQSNVVARGFNNAFSGTMLMLQDYRFAGVPSLRVNVPMLFGATNEDVDHIEVQLGPTSAAYGPNAASGVLHVITKSPFTSPGTTFTFDGGTRDFARGSIRHARPLGDRMAFKISGEMMNATDWRFDDPGEPSTIVRPAANPSATRSKDTVPNFRDFGLRRASGEARLDVRPTGNTELITTVSATRFGRGLEMTTLGSAQARNWTYTTVQERFRAGRFFAQAFINMSDAGNRDSTDLEGTYLLRSGQPIVDQSRVMVGQVQHGYRLNARQDFTYGADYISTDPRTLATINGRNEDDDRVHEYGGYLQSSTVLASKLDLLGTLRVDKNDRVGGSQLSPRVALVYKPSSTQNVRLTYNRAFNSPANYSMFLDLIQTRNGPYTVRAVGNPPKTGWHFKRDCDATISGGLCMKSLFLGTQANTFVNATASAALPGLIGSQAAAIQAAFVPKIVLLLQSQGYSQAQASAAAPGVATQLITYLTTLKPTAAQVGTRIAKVSEPGNKNTAPSDVRDLAALSPSYNTDYELGYKAILRDKLRISASAWYQRRGDVGVPADVATPSVYADSASLATYLAAALTPAVQSMGVSAGAAAAASADAAQTLAQNFKGVPLGIITFDDARFATPTDIYATYTTYDKEVDVSGADVAVDYVWSPRLDVGGSFSWVSKTVFEGTVATNGLPLMLNAPGKKGSVSARFHDAQDAWSIDARGRFFTGYPVNSNLYATDYTFRSGTRSWSYDDVTGKQLIDLGLSWKPRESVLWSVNAENLLNTPYRTFAGTPLLGRMVTTRVQYQLR